MTFKKRGVATDGAGTIENPQPPAKHSAGKQGGAILTHRQEAYIAKDITTLYRSVFRRAFEGKSRSAIIKAKCLSCTNLSREDITFCTVQICPLWAIRPYQGGQDV